MIPTGHGCWMKPEEGGTVEMRKSKLSILCGLKVAEAVLAEGDTGISFENGISLAIYNRYELEGLVLHDAQRLVGNMVARVDEDAATATIRFENNLAIRVDMRDAAYSGPEAMQLCIPGEPTVIWI